MSAMTTTQARSSLYRLVDEVAQSHQPILITGKNNNAVLVSESDWESIQETLYLMSVPRMAQSIKEGLLSSVGDCDQDLDW